MHPGTWRLFKVDLGVGLSPIMSACFGPGAAFFEWYSSILVQSISHVSALHYRAWI